jgi:hypothetical protein
MYGGIDAKDRWMDNMVEERCAKRWTELWMEEWTDNGMEGWIKLM